jgi:hypothetical protein
MTWLLNNAIGIIGILVGGFIAYHVYFLSRKITLKGRLTHKDQVRKLVEPLLQNITQGRSSDVELVNVKKYLKHYPQNNDFNRHGYTYLRAELKTLRFDGIECFCGVRELYKKPNGTFSLRAGNGAVRENYNTLEAGVIPYEWIEHVDGRGDEFSYRPQFFLRFNGTKKSPYKYLTYHIESETYHKNSDPMDFQWKCIDVES